MIGWWRQQRRALLALLITASAVLGVYAWLDLIPSLQAQTEVVTTAVDGEAEFGDQHFDLRSARWDEFTAPDGARTLSITVTVRPGDEPDQCGPLVLREVDGAREWADARETIGAPWDAGDSYCDQEASAPYRLFAVFLIPEDVTGPFWLSIDGIYGESVRFFVEV